MERIFVTLLTSFVETVPIINHRIAYKTEPRLVTIPIQDDEYLSLIINYFTAKYGPINYRIVEDGHTIEEAEYELRDDLLFNS